MNRRFLCGVYDRVSVLWNNIQFRKNMQKRIETADIEIKELTSSEKKDLRTFWKTKYGLTPDFKTYRWYYSVNGMKDPRYISEDIYANYIWTKLNDVERCKGINDKNYLDIFYSGFRMPETVFHNINGVFLDREYNVINKDTAVALAMTRDKVVVKAAIESCQGNGVSCIDGKKIQELLEEFGKDYIVQEVVKQHRTFAQLNDSSVNVVRMTSLLLNGEVHVLDSIIRVGAPGNFTDHKNVAIGINNDATLKDYGVTVKGEKVIELANGFKFGGMKLVGFEEMVSLVKKLHPKTPQAMLIGWDLTVDEEGHVIIIEANMQFPGITRGQDCNGPFFGDLTGEVLSFVLQK